MVHPRRSLYGTFAILALLSLQECFATRATAEKPAVDIGAINREVVAKLSGAEAIAPRCKLPDRYTLKNRQIAIAWLEGYWKNLGLDVQRHEYNTGENLYAVLPATSSPAAAEYIVVGAHYDSARRSPGANDNATGVALVTAVAAVLKGLPQRNHNVMFVLFDEEEDGLIGSKAFARKMKKDKLKVYAVHTFDQIGWDQNGNRALELERPYAGAVELYKAAAERLAARIPLKVTKENYADHSSFRRLKFRAVGLTEEYRNHDTTPYMHTRKDTFQTVQLDYLLSTTNLVVEVMKTLVTGAGSDHEAIDTPDGRTPDRRERIEEKTDNARQAPPQ